MNIEKIANKITLALTIGPSDKSNTPEELTKEVSKYIGLKCEVNTHASFIRVYTKSGNILIDLGYEQEKTGKKEALFKLNGKGRSWLYDSEL